MKRTDRRIYIAAFIFYLGAICLLCFMKGDHIPDMNRTFLGLPADKAAHFLMFLPYPILASLSFIDNKSGTGRNITTLTILTIVGFGLAYGTEMLQAHTGHRSYEIGDFIADSAGLLTGMAATIIFIITQNRRK